MKQETPDSSTNLIKSSKEAKPYTDKESLHWDLSGDLDRTLATMKAHLEKLEKEKQKSEK